MFILFQWCSLPCGSFLFHLFIIDSLLAKRKFFQQRRIFHWKTHGKIHNWRYKWKQEIIPIYRWDCLERMNIAVLHEIHFRKESLWNISNQRKNKLNWMVLCKLQGKKKTKRKPKKKKNFQLNENSFSRNCSLCVYCFWYFIEHSKKRKHQSSGSNRWCCLAAMPWTVFRNRSLPTAFQRQFLQSEDIFDYMNY